MIEPDRALADRARRGDRPALVALYDRHKAALLGFLVQMTHDRELAEDVFQEVWIKVMREIGRYDPDRAPFRTWLFKIGGNAAIDHLRREKRRRILRPDARVGDSNNAPLDQIASPLPGPSAESEASSTADVLRRAMETLSAEQRAAICLRHLMGLGYREIAATLRVPEGTAKTLVHRGIHVLRRALPEGFDG